MKRDTLLINLSAIAHAMHESPSCYQTFYDRFGEKLGGFTGVYDFTIEMAQQFTRYEETVGEDLYEWINAVDKFVESVYSCTELPDAKQLYIRAAEAIIAQLFEPAPDPEKCPDCRSDEVNYMKCGSGETSDCDLIEMKCYDCGCLFTNIYERKLTSQTVTKTGNKS